MEKKTRPRFIFDITEEQEARALRIFSEYGLRKAIMGKLLDELLDMVEKHGYVVFGVIMDKDTRLSEVVPSLNSARKVVEDGRS